MKRILFFLLLSGFALMPAGAHAQNLFRFSEPFPSVTSLYQTPFLVANVPPNSPILAVCHSPANQVPCTNYATTYTGASAACPNGAQDTPDPSGSTSACQSTGDAQGNIAFWAPSGTYDYTVCIAGTVSCFGPYTVTLGGTSLQLQTNGTNNGSQTKLNLAAGSNITITDNGTGTDTIASTGGGGGGNPQLDNCTPDQTGNSFYSVLPLTNYFNAHWELVFNTTTYFNCQVFIPTAQTGATLVLDIAANDGTAGHTASFQTCDGVINSGTINTGSLTCAVAQTFTTTSTAYNRVTLTFNVQSTLSNNSILVVKIGVSPTGTAPTANLIVYPHFIL